MVKHLYETLYILSPDLSDEEREQANQKFKDFLEKKNAEIVKFDPWPLQRLAYRIKKKNQGYYVFLEHVSSPEVINELSREMRLDERVLRHINIKKAERFGVIEKRAAAK